MSEATADIAPQHTTDSEHVKRIAALFEAHHAGVTRGRYAEEAIVADLERGFVEVADDYSWAIVARVLDRRQTVKGASDDEFVSLEAGTNLVMRMAWTNDTGRAEVIRRIQVPCAVVAWKNHEGEQYVVAPLSLAVTKPSARFGDRGVYVSAPVGTPDAAQAPEGVASSPPTPDEAPTPADAPLDAQTQAWVDGKPPEYEAPEVTAEAQAGAAAAIEQARAKAPKGEVESLAFDYEAGGKKEPEDASPRALAAIDNAHDPLPKRAFRTDTKGWPGREEFESQGRKQSESVTTPGADSTLADSLSPQMGLGFHVPVVQVKPPGLADKFIVPPFSVLDTRAGYWQDRRRAWLSLGMRGETSAEQAYRPDGTQQPPTGAYQPAAEAVRAPMGVAKVAREMSASGDGGEGRTKHYGRTAESMNVPKLKGAAFNDGHTMLGGKDARPHHGQGGAENHGGRAQGLTYGESARTKDPAFYDQKDEVEARLGRTLTTAEFETEHYVQPVAESASVATGTSVFDPVLCEVIYRWFSGPGAQVLDPFAGGVVRGLVAGVLGRKYTGIELRPEQLADNREQAERLLGPDAAIDYGRQPVMPTWIEGDATQQRALELPEADLVMSCPPYSDLEVYSDDPRDLSNMPYEVFRPMLATAIAQSTERLKRDRFSVWVIGEARGKDGNEYGIVPDLIKSAQSCGLALYNSVVLLNSVGSAALRAQLIAKSGRKVTRVHQSVLVFVKGAAKEAAKACGSMEVEA